MSILIQKLTVKDVQHFMQLLKVFEDVFETENFKMPGEDYLSGLLSDPKFHAYVAMDNNKVVAGLTGYTLQTYYSYGAYLFVYDLAVATSYQRQGIGSLLMKTIIQDCKGTSIEEVFVQADMVDDYAIEFYRSTGAREERTMNFSYLIN